jgi:hypothetical protein
MDEPLGAYAGFEGGAAQLRDHLAQSVVALRAAYALSPNSSNHRTQVQVWLLAELNAQDPRAVAAMLVVAMDQLTRCDAPHR